MSNIQFRSLDADKHQVVLIKHERGVSWSVAARCFLKAMGHKMTISVRQYAAQLAKKAEEQDTAEAAAAEDWYEECRYHDMLSAAMIAKNERRDQLLPADQL